VEFAEVVGEIARVSTYNEQKCATGVHPEAVDLGNAQKMKDNMVGATGFEPSKVSNQKANGFLPSALQHPAKSSMSGHMTQPADGKISTSPEHENTPIYPRNVLPACTKNPLPSVNSWPNLRQKICGYKKSIMMAKKK
jgi:hypothetical protein